MDNVKKIYRITSNLYNKYTDFYVVNVAFLKLSRAFLAFPLDMLSRDNLTPSLKSFAKPLTTNAAEAFKSTKSKIGPSYSFESNLIKRSAFS